jgi:hypothetical protein
MEQCKCKECEGKENSFWENKFTEEEKPKSVYDKLVFTVDNLERLTAQEVKNILNGLADEIDNIDDKVIELKNDSAHELALDRISKRLF